MPVYDDATYDVATYDSLDATPPSGEPNIAVTRTAGVALASLRTQGETKSETRVAGATLAENQDT